MMRTLFLFIVFVTGMPVPDVRAQSADGSPNLNLRSRSSEDTSALAAEAAEKLKEASKGGTLEKARLAAEEALKNKQDLAGKAKAAAQSLMKENSIEEQELREKGEAAMRAAMKNLSSEGKSLLQPDGAEPAVPGGPVPKPLQPLDAPAPAVVPEKVTITATLSGFFDANEALAIFTGNVKVYHPQFYMECEELEVHMEEDAMETKPMEPKGDNDAILVDSGASTGVGADEMGGIKMAIAKGPKVMIRKQADDGEMQIAICKEATFVSATGEMTLRVWPQVQRGQSLQIASDATTVMVLNKDGSLRTNGPSRTEIIRGDTSANGGIPATPDGQ